MTTPKLSVIVPVYNAEKTIKQCLSSVCNQTLKEIEIIVIDDCSTDGTYKFLTDFCKRFPNIILLKNEKNSGTGYTRNRGLEAASGEYIGFVDNDDWIEQDYFEKLLNKAEEQNADICVTLKITNHSDNKKLTHTLKPNDLKEIVFIKRTPPWAKIIKKDFILKNNIKFDTTRGEDIYPAFIEAYNANIIAYCKDTNYNCRIRSGSISHQKTKEKDLDEIRLYKKIINHIQNSNDKKYWLKLIKERGLISFDFLYKRADKETKREIIKLYKEIMYSKNPLFEYNLWKIQNFTEKITNILRK